MLVFVNAPQDPALPGMSANLMSMWMSWRSRRVVVRAVDLHGNPVPFAVVVQSIPAATRVVVQRPLNDPVVIVIFAALSTRVVNVTPLQLDTMPAAGAINPTLPSSV
jgi:hypothetical protein